MDERIYGRNWIGFEFEDHANTHWRVVGRINLDGWHIQSRDTNVILPASTGELYFYHSIQIEAQNKKGYDMETPEPKSNYVIQKDETVNRFTVYTKSDVESLLTSLPGVDVLRRSDRWENEYDVYVSPLYTYDEIVMFAKHTLDNWFAINNSIEGEET
jgi:hypothetical protein